jgi:hypothetical protein
MRFGAGCACPNARIDCWSVCFGWSRAASLKPIDNPKQTALCPKVMRASSGGFRLRFSSYGATGGWAGIFTIAGRFWLTRMDTKIVPKPLGGVAAGAHSEALRLPDHPLRPAGTSPASGGRRSSNALRAARCNFRCTIVRSHANFCACGRVVHVNMPPTDRATIRPMGARGPGRSG